MIYIIYIIAILYINLKKIDNDNCHRRHWLSLSDSLKFMTSDKRFLWK